MTDVLGPDTVADDDRDDEHGRGATDAQPLRRVLVAIIAVAVVAAAVAGGVVWGRHSGRPAASPAAYLPGEHSVDAGFVHDMITHHSQAVTMAGYVRDHTTDPSVRLIAFDIETSQETQIGQMQGWLEAWGLPRNTEQPQMWWMPAEHRHLVDGLMPGMASPAEMSKLEHSTGKAMDVLFLQMMIYHHQGGLPMAQDAVTAAREPYVRDLAQAILDEQQPQIIAMEQLLRQLGGSPLRPPPD